MKELTHRGIATCVLFVVSAFVSVSRAQDQQFIDGSITGSTTITTKELHVVVNVPSIVLGEGDVLSIEQPTDTSRMLIRVGSGSGSVLAGGELRRKIRWNGTVCINGRRLDGDVVSVGGDVIDIGPSMGGLSLVGGCSVNPERFFAGGPCLCKGTR